MAFDKEWAGLIDLWQGNTPTPSLEKLAKRVRSETRKQYLAYSIETIVSLCMVFIYVRQIRSGLLPAELAAALVSMLFVVIWMFKLTRTMKGTWQASEKSTDAFLKVSINRREAQLSWYRFVRKCLIGSVFFVGLWGPWMLIEHWAKYRMEPWRALIGFGGIFLIILLVEISVRLRMKQIHRELQMLRSTHFDFYRAGEDINVREADGGQAGGRSPKTPRE